MLAARILLHIYFKIVRLKSKINCVKTRLTSKKDKSIYIDCYQWKENEKNEIIVKLVHNTSIITVFKVVIEFVME